MTEDSLTTRIDGPVATLVLRRPETRNALNRMMLQRLAQSLDDLHHQGSVRAVILTGADDVFSSGTDLKELQAGFEEPQPFQRWSEDSRLWLELMEQLLRFPKPILVGLNGPAIGTALALALTADLIIGSPHASLQLPESRLGLSSGLAAPLLSFRGTSMLLNRMAMTGDALTAEEARQAGLLSEIVDAPLVWARCMELAQQCARGARESHQLSKQLLNETIAESLWTQLSIGAANLATARTTPAAREGVAAFLDKREPDWDRLD